MFRETSDLLIFLYIQCQVQEFPLRDAAERFERVLGEEGRMTEPRLRERLGERVSAEGRSRAGLHLRFSRALQDGPFRFNGAHWELRNGN